VFALGNLPRHVVAQRSVFHIVALLNKRRKMYDRENDSVKNMAVTAIDPAAL